MQIETIHLDGGRAFFKGLFGRVSYTAPNAVYPVESSLAESILERDPATPYLVRVSCPELGPMNEYYMFGEHALREGGSRVWRETGERRYFPDYIGAFFVASVFGHYDQKHVNVTVNAMHAPVDYGRRRQIASAFKVLPDNPVKPQALVGAGTRWFVSSGAGSHLREMTINVVSVRLTDEVLGGMGHLVTDSSRKKDLDKSILVVDIGGGTTDVASIFAGELQRTGIATLVGPDGNSFGINDVVGTLRQSITANEGAFLGSLKLTDSMLQSAIASGEIYKPSNMKTLDVKQYVDSACFPLVRALEGAYARLNGDQYDLVLLTGGGSVVLEPVFKKVLETGVGRDKNTIQLLGKNPAQAHLWNVMGLQKLWSLQNGI